MFKLQFFIVPLTIFLWSLAVNAGQMVAGVSRVEITPEAGFAMGGYEARQGPSTGIHDPLFATVLWIECDGLSVVFVSCDLRSFPSSRVVKLARDRKLADNVLISSTHTHSGPITWEDKSWPAGPVSWYAKTENQILEAIADARRHQFRARISGAEGAIYLAHNRRLVLPEAAVQMLWRNPDRKPTSPLDPAVTVIRVDDDQGRPRAILSNFACHAVILGPDNRQISADYPGYTARAVERDFPGALCLFTQGAAGDLNPYLDKQPLQEGAYEEARRMGDLLAGEIARVTRRISTSSDKDSSLLISSSVVAIPNRWERSRELQAGVSGVLINKEIAVGAIAGEPFVDLQISMKDRCEARVCLLLGYTYSEGGEWLGYLPTIKAASEGGYGAGYNTSVAVGAGEMLIDRLLVSITDLQGRFQKTPSR